MRWWHRGRHGFKQLLQRQIRVPHGSKKPLSQPRCKRPRLRLKLRSHASARRMGKPCLTYVQLSVHSGLRSPWRAF